MSAGVCLAMSVRCRSYHPCIKQALAKAVTLVNRIRTKQYALFGVVYKFAFLIPEREYFERCLR